MVGLSTFVALSAEHRVIWCSISLRPACCSSTPRGLFELVLLPVDNSFSSSDNDRARVTQKIREQMWQQCGYILASL